MKLEEEMEKGNLNILLGRVRRLHFRCCYTELTKIGVTRGQPRILRYLKFHDGCIQRELCENCHLEPATVTNILGKMERDGFIRRCHQPGSRRNMQVFLLPKGEARLCDVDKVHRHLEKEIFKGFTPEEKRQMAEFMERMIGTMEKAEEKKGNGSLQEEKKRD